MIPHQINLDGSVDISGLTGFWLPLWQYQTAYLNLLIKANQESDEAVDYTAMSWNAGTDIFSYEYQGTPDSRSIPSDPGLTVIYVKNGVMNHSTFPFNTVPSVDGCPLALRVDFTTQPSPGGTWPVILPEWTRGFVSSAELDAAVQALQTTVDALDAAVQSVLADVSQNSADLNTAGNAITALQGDVSNLTAQTNSLTSSLSSLQASLTSLTSTVSANGAAIAANSAAITSLDARVTALENP